MRSPVGRMNEGRTHRGRCMTACLCATAVLQRMAAHANMFSRPMTAHFLALQIVCFAHVASASTAGRHAQALKLTCNNRSSTWST